MKKKLKIFSVLFICFSVVTYYVVNKGDAYQGFENNKILPIKAAVIYNGDNENLYWKDTFSQLEQSTMLNLSVDAIDITKSYNLNDYDIIYPDKFIMEAKNSNKIKNEIVSFVENGGAVFLDNSFHSFFEKDFIGAKKYKKIENVPQNLKSKNSDEDLNEIKDIIVDFSNLYKDYSDKERLSDYDYGYAIEPSTAKSLIYNDYGSLYTLNQYGEGLVFFTNPLLPNIYSLNGFSLEIRDENQKSLANTTASANQIILNKFAEYISKTKYGFSVSRVFGSFGRPSMAWQLHYEEITGIENDSAIIFGELAKEYNQIPSYTLIRNTYKWFSRYETITYLEGKQNKNEVKYEIDFNENAYSSGKHIVSGDEWLSLNEIENAGSYFIDNKEYIDTAYPCISDFNNDGINDILSGSSDGKLYLFTGKNNDKRFSVNKPIKITDLNNKEISVKSYSAPVVLDINDDRLDDIVVGSGEGVVYSALGGKDGFNNLKVLVDTKIEGQVFPEVGDLNGDNKLDLLIGTNKGKLICYYGVDSNKLSISNYIEYDISDVDGLNDIGNWIAPRLYDLDKDGTKELYIGTFDGYIAKTIFKNGDLYSKGYMTTKELNYKGNNRIKFGNNCVPLFSDVNDDNVVDIVAGQLEYGLAYPIDSEYFPYKEELKKQVDYILDNNMYISPHFYTNVSASDERERYELDAHLKALDYYGIPTDNVFGINQHTWKVSENTPKQSFLNAYKKGMYWNSGFSPANSDIIPQIAKENVIAYPFFLEDKGNKTMLIHNNSVLGYNSEGLEDISAKYDVPVSVYYHCDLIYKDEKQAKDIIQKASNFQSKYNYNFVREDQLILASAASYNLDIDIKKNKTDDFDITINPVYNKSDHPLYNEDYIKSSGCRISLSKSLKNKNIVTDANVVYKKDNNIYVSADKPFRVFEYDLEFEESKLRRVNIPANINNTTEGIEINFLDDGMMQCVVEGKVTTTNEGWDVEYNKNLNITTLTKFADKEKLIIN